MSRAIRILLFATALVLLSPPAAHAQSLVCAPSGNPCHTINAVYGSWIARRGEVVRINIPAEAVVPEAWGTMFLVAPGTCVGSVATIDAVIVASGNASAWEWTVPRDAKIDPCAVSLVVNVKRCYGDCPPLPAWLANPTARVTIGANPIQALVNLFKMDLMRWILSVAVGGLVGSILFRRIVEAAMAATEGSGYVEASRSVTSDSEDGECSGEPANSE